MNPDVDLDAVVAVYAKQAAAEELSDSLHATIASLFKRAMKTGELSTSEIAAAIETQFEVCPRGPVTDADDVREALYSMLRWGVEDDEMGLVDRILSRFEVRPRGPVTDDVRDALVDLLGSDANFIETGSYKPEFVPGHAADAILGAFEVRPRRVESAVDTWQYGVRHSSTSGAPLDVPHGSLKGAEQSLHSCGTDCHLIRRQFPGPWIRIEEISS